MPRSPALTTLLRALAGLLLAGSTAAAPMLYPATPEGPAEWRDERDVAPYLAAWKRAAFARTRALAKAVTPNQLAYDVHWYDLDLTFSPQLSRVTGMVRMRGTVVNGPISTVDLDLNASMTATAVWNNDIPSSYSRTGDVISVNLGSSYATGATLDIRVAYQGTPVAGSFGYSVTNGRQLIWSLSEPYGARTWWPCKDAPEDKADSVTIRFTVPTGLKTASNGTLISSVDNGSQVVTRWRESHPIAPYLVSIASYPYTQTLDWYRPSPTDSMRIDFFNYPETAPSVAPIQARVKDMLAAYSARFGLYPFFDEKYGHAQFNFGGGMEHQTCTSLGAFSEFVVAHELAHQWWGDMVTCRDFHHIWLNEGFATYGEALWAESQGGPAAYHADLALNKFYGPGSVWVPNALDEARIFDSDLSYDKGSWVLHMLRHVLGDAAFFGSLAQYRSSHQYGTATTEDFRDACEAASGRDLDAFFQQWVYGERYPIYRPSWTSAQAAGGYDVTLTLEQRQGWQLFTMPVDVRIQTAGGPRDFVVPDSLASQTFVLHVDAQPLSLAIDPDDWILRQLEQDVVQPPFDRGVLVVNGVDWNAYGTEITTAYTDKAFFGDYSIDFWDHFPAPLGGYPATLPPPLGRGPVPPEVLGHYRNVVWVGNDQNGDLESWIQTPVLNYLRAGGNLLLMTRQGESFLSDSLLAYLGITLTSTGTTPNDCLATRPGFVNLTRTGTQSLCAVFDTVRTRADTQLLFKTTVGFTPQRGLGVIRMPVGGAGLRSQGGRFAFLSGRPYRWTHTLLKSDVNTLLSQYFLEPLNGVGVEPVPVVALRLGLPHPNPSAAGTRLQLELPAPMRVRFDVLDVAGRVVRSRDLGQLAAGSHPLEWDGLDARGAHVGAGLYWVRVRAGSSDAFQRIVRLD